MLDLSIILVNWNTRNFLRSCLESIIKHTENLSYEIIVVDNNSSDGSTEMVRHLFPAVRLIVNQKNEGFAKGNNQAYQAAQGEYTLYLNPDTEINNSAFEQMLEFLKTHPQAGAVAPRLLHPDGALNDSCPTLPSILTDFMEMTYLDRIFPHSNFFNRLNMGGWKYDKTRQVDQPMMACLMVRKSVIEQIGLLDEQFYPAYYEDVDFSYRMKKAGFKTYFLSEAVVTHYGGATHKHSQDRIKAIIWMTRNKFLFFEKVYGRIARPFLALNLLLRILLVYTLLVDLTSFLFGKPKDSNFQRIRAGAMLKGYREFIRTVSNSGNIF